jgi:hypothetical protein
MPRTGRMGVRVPPRPLIPSSSDAAQIDVTQPVPITYKKPPRLGSGSCAAFNRGFLPVWSHLFDYGLPVGRVATTSTCNKVFRLFANVWIGSLPYHPRLMRGERLSGVTSTSNRELPRTCRRQRSAPPARIATGSNRRSGLATEENRPKLREQVVEPRSRRARQEGR